MYVIHRTFWIGSLPPLCAILGIRTRQLHLFYVWKKEDMPHCDYMIIFLLVLVYIALMRYMSAA